MKNCWEKYIDYLLLKIMIQKSINFQKSKDKLFEIRNGLFIENKAANKEIEEWLTSNLGNAHTPSDD